MCFPTLQQEEAVDFLSAWEAERLRREAGVIGRAPSAGGP